MRISEYRCGKIKAGNDRGQRYVVAGKERSTGKEVEIGWTNKKDGGALFEMARKWPALTDVRVIDRGKDTP